MSDDLPHPGPLPKERENRSPTLVKTCGWICRTVIRKTRNVEMLFPLPGGEGQGEGERFSFQILAMELRK